MLRVWNVTSTQGRPFPLYVDLKVIAPGECELLTGAEIGLLGESYDPSCYVVSSRRPSLLEERHDADD